MRIESLNSSYLLKYKSTINKLLVESYMVNFNLSKEQSVSICSEKILSLIDFLKQNSATLLGAFYNDELIGFLWLYKYTYFGESRLHVNQIVVSKVYRGRGIAKLLLKEAEKIAVKNKITIIDLNVSESNSTAIQMYESINFTTERRYMKKILKDEMHADSNKIK